MRFKPSRGRLCVRTPFTSVKTNGTPLEILTFQTPPPLSLDMEKSREEYPRPILQISRVYRRLSNCSRSKLSCPAEIWSKPRGRTDYYPSGFRERERDGRGESGLHCYYNETRINTSRLYTRDRCNYLLMMIFVAVGGRGAPGDGGRVGGSQQQPPPPPPQFARPSDKLSEIMSQEIGSLARGWLTAGLPASSLPAALSPSFLKLPFTGLRTRLSRCVPKDRPIDLYTISFFLFLSAFLVSFENASKFRLVFTPSATYPAFACIICHSLESAVKFHGLFRSSWRSGGDIIRVISKPSSLDFFSYWLMK